MSDLDPAMQQSIEDITTRALHRVLNERKSIDEATHSKHHRFIEEMIKIRDERQQRYKKIQDHVFGWAAVAFVIFLIGSIGREISAWIGRGSNL